MQHHIQCCYNENLRGRKWFTPKGRPRKVNDLSKLSCLASTSTMSVTDSRLVCLNSSLNFHAEVTVFTYIFTRPT